jgi:hypothetical protein
LFRTSTHTQHGHVSRHLHDQKNTVCTSWRWTGVWSASSCSPFVSTCTSSGSPPLHDNVREESWRYPEWASDTGVAMIYSYCDSLIPPKAKWWPHQRPAQQCGLPLIPLVQTPGLSCRALRTQDRHLTTPTTHGTQYPVVMGSAVRSTSLLICGSIKQPAMTVQMYSLVSCA